MEVRHSNFEELSVASFFFLVIPCEVLYFCREHIPMMITALSLSLGDLCSNELIEVHYAVLLGI